VHREASILGDRAKADRRQNVPVTRLRLCMAVVERKNNRQLQLKPATRTLIQMRISRHYGTSV